MFLTRIVLVRVCLLSIIDTPSLRVYTAWQVMGLQAHIPQVSIPLSV